MEGYVGCVLLEELLAIGKIGVYIDRPPLGKTKADSKSPYLYHYRAESIKSWAFDNQNHLTALLLEDNIPELDENGLIQDYKKEYKFLKLMESGVQVQIYSEEDEIIHEDLLNLKQIPFVIFEISQSLLTDIASYQIALVNLASADMNFVLKANYPFYTEQFSPMAEMAHLKTEVSEETSDISVGVTHGRKYAKGLERPQFINPSSESLDASMRKEDALVLEIRQLVSLSLLNLKPVCASQEARQEDNQGLEAGLSYIGLELAHGERSIAEIWCNYEGQSFNGKIVYPEKYSLKSDEDCRKEAEELATLSPKIPSRTFQKETAKNIVNILYGMKLKQETLNQIMDEIDKAPALITNPDSIIQDHQEGLVSDVTASILRGYPEGEAEKAKIDQAERAARIVVAQTKAGG